MGITERKERERQEMRQLILEAAKTVFIEEGYEKASIRAIAERIEYSPATIYLYFKDKDELFYVVHELGFEKLLAVLQQTEVITNPVERLRRGGEAYIRFALENPELYDLMFISRAPMKALHKAYETPEWDCGRDSFEYLCRTVQQCIDQGYLRATDIHVAAITFWSFIHGLVSLHIRDRFTPLGEEVDIEPLMDQAFSLVMHLFQPLPVD
jgi:AcrR family transcriptional regulator